MGVNVQVVNCAGNLPLELGAKSRHAKSCDRSRGETRAAGVPHLCVTGRHIPDEV